MSLFIWKKITLIFEVFFFFTGYELTCCFFFLLLKVHTHLSPAESSLMKSLAAYILVPLSTFFPIIFFQVAYSRFDFQYFIFCLHLYFHFAYYLVTILLTIGPIWCLKYFLITIYHLEYYYSVLLTFYIIQLWTGNRTIGSEEFWSVKYWEELLGDRQQKVGMRGAMSRIIGNCISEQRALNFVV